VFETVIVKNNVTGNETTSRKNIFQTQINVGEDKKWMNANDLSLNPNPPQLPMEIP